MWKDLLQLVCPVPRKASTTQRSLLVSFTAPMLLALAAMPSADLDQGQPLWLQVCLLAACLPACLRLRLRLRLRLCL